MTTDEDAADLFNRIGLAFQGYPNTMTAEQRAVRAEYMALFRELAALRPLRAAVRRYGRALARINDTGTQMRAGDDFDAWYAAAKALDARALALAAEEGQG